MGAESGESSPQGATARGGAAQALDHAGPGRLPQASEGAELEQVTAAIQATCGGDRALAVVADLGRPADGERVVAAALARWRAGSGWTSW
jgi:hypothetical protein